MKEIIEQVGEFLLNTLPAVALIAFFIGVRYAIAPLIEIITIWMFG